MGSVRNTDAVISKRVLEAAKDLEIPLEQKNLKVTLEAAGATFNDVVKINTYVLGEYMKEYVAKGVDIEYLGAFPVPAVTLVGVSSLANDGQLIESEVIAVTNK